MEDVQVSSSLSRTAGATGTTSVTSQACALDATPRTEDLGLFAPLQAEDLGLFSAGIIVRWDADERGEEWRNVDVDDAEQE